MSVAITDLGVMLFVKEGDVDPKYKYFIPVKTAPATGGAPNQIEATELDSPYQQFVLDREQTPAYDFTYNYTVENFQRAKVLLDGTTTNDYIIVFSDKSGWTFSGVGKTWTDAVSGGTVVNGMMSFAVSKKEWMDDVTALIDTTTIPEGKFNAFDAI